MATAHMGLGTLMWAQQRLSAAHTHLSKSAKLYQQINDRRNAAKVLINLALVAQDRGNYQQASKSYSQALDLQQQLGDIHGQGLSLNNLGAVYARLGDFTTAHASLQQGIGLLRGIGHTHGIIISIATLAELAHLQADHRRSVMLYGAFETLSKQVEMVLPPAQQLEITQNLAKSHELLRPQSYGTFWKRGFRMTLEEVLNIVLG